MKNICKITALLFALHLSGCSDDSEKSKQDKMTAMLTASAWGEATVTHTDGDLSDQYEHFSILFTDKKSSSSDGQYFISNGGNAFSETSGTWQFNDDQTRIILDSGKTMDIQLDEIHLQLDFITDAPAGRIRGLSGHFIFDLQPI